jgi:hypothetical protein
MALKVLATRAKRTLAMTRSILRGLHLAGSIASFDLSIAPMEIRFASQKLKLNSGRTKTMVRDVRYWHKADIPSCTANVRFWG